MLLLKIVIFKMILHPYNHPQRHILPPRSHLICFRRVNKDQLESLVKEESGYLFNSCKVQIRKKEKQYFPQNLESNFKMYFDKI